MIKNKEIFLNKIKSLLPYFMGFFDNRSILLKIYSKNCVLGGLDQKPIIMIIYDENTFFTNNG